MRITKYQKSGKDKYRIYFDNNTSLLIYEDVIFENSLLYKKELDSEELEKVLFDNSVSILYNQAIKYLTLRIRSEEEIRKYLEKKEENIAIINLIIEKLKHQGYLNDEVFVKAFIQDKIYLSNYGPWKIKNELTKYIKDDNLINQYIENIDNQVILENMKKLIEKYIKINRKYSGNVLKQKIYNNLINLGYDKKMIYDELQNSNFNETENLIKEYQKLKKKYEKKYDSYKLEMVIKQKLMAKGYNISDIDNVKFI